jgi:hypothetical protein
MDDIHAVLNALEVDRAAFFGAEDSGPLALLFAATYPERVERLICFGTYAAMTADPEYTIGIPVEILEELISAVPDLWGTGSVVDLVTPSIADGPFRERWAQYERSVAGPEQTAAIIRRMVFSDVRTALPAISCPTLVLHRTGDRMVPLEMGRYIAVHIEGAQFVELAGIDHVPFVGDVDAVVSEIEAFVTGQPPPQATDRTLATVLFTDIVGSTRLASDLGDRRWNDLLDDHDALIRRQLARFRGRAVKSTGDGFLAMFDGPVRAFAAPAPSAMVPKGWASTSGPASIPARSVSGRMTSPALPCTLRPGWKRWPGPVTCWCLRPSHRWWWGRE